jgi:hypothetical protein
VPQSVWNLEIAPIGSQEQAERIIKGLREQRSVEDLPPVSWTVTYLDLPSPEAALEALENDLDAIDAAWREVLTIGLMQDPRTRPN